MINTIEENKEAKIEVKKSQFISNMFYVENEEDAKKYIDEIKSKYHDAKHVCYAYVIDEITEEGNSFRIEKSSDNGEPSGTAGKPILGQINSNELTDIIILVIRYFGGVKLGTSGLIGAYKTAAADAIQNAEIVTRTVDEEYTFDFEYPLMNAVMKVARDMDARIVSQSYDMDCRMTLSIRRSKMDELKEKVAKALSPF